MDLCAYKLGQPSVRSKYVLSDTVDLLIQSGKKTIDTILLVEWHIFIGALSAREGLNTEDIVLSIQTRSYARSLVTYFETNGMSTGMFRLTVSRNSIESPSRSVK